MLILLAAFMLLDRSFTSTASIADRQDGLQRGRQAMELMTRPVCMTSNIQSVLFVPDTLDFYVANADGQNVASHTRFTKYNLKDLLGPPAAIEQTKAEAPKKKSTGF